MKPLFSIIVAGTLAGTVLAQSNTTPTDSKSASVTAGIKKTADKAETGIAAANAEFKADLKQVKKQAAAAQNKIKKTADKAETGIAAANAEFKADLKQAQKSKNGKKSWWQWW